MMREQILTFLERNSRIDLKELAILLGSDEAVIANEIQQMEKEGIICGYHTLIDWDKTARESVTALIELKISPQEDRGFDKIAEKIRNYPEVQSVYLMSGGFDLAVFIEGKTLKEVAFFVAQKLAPMNSIQSTATHFVLKKYKDKGVNYGIPETDERGYEM